MARHGGPPVGARSVRLAADQPARESAPLPLQRVRARVAARRLSRCGAAGEAVPPRAAVGVGGPGVVVACAGVAVLFTTDHNARSAFLLTVGLVLMLVAWFGGRIQLEGFEILGARARV